MTIAAGDGPDDPLLEASLQTLSLSTRPLDPAFTSRVLAALPPRAVPAAPAEERFAEWWRRQGPALVLGTTGTLVMLITGDAPVLLNSWWQQAGEWLTGAATADLEGIGAWLISMPGGTASPEAYLGLVGGAVMLAAGAGMYLLRAMVPDAAALPAASLGGRL